MDPNTALAFAPDTGVIVSIDTETGEQEILANSFGAYLESFRDALLSGKVEWAEGWVATG